MSKTQAQADKEFRERYARDDYTVLKSDLLARIERARRDIHRWQRFADANCTEEDSTQIRDYQISLNKLVDHIRRMKP